MSHFEHYELNTSDPDAAKAFYSSVFGWKYEDVKMDGGSVYTMIASKNGRFGGLQRKPMESVPDHWLGYISVEDCEGTMEKVDSAGGKLEAGPIEIPGMGKYAVFTDPTGSAFAVWERVGPPPEAAAAAPDAGAKKKAKKKAGKKKAAKKAEKAEKKAAKKKAGKKAAKTGGKKAAKKTGGKKAAKKTGGKKAAKKTGGSKPAKKAAKKKTAKSKAAKKK